MLKDTLTDFRKPEKKQLNDILIVFHNLLLYTRLCHKNKKMIKKRQYTFQYSAFLSESSGVT